jgi:hypothetical protein
MIIDGSLDSDGKKNGWHKRWHGIKDYGIGDGSLGSDGIDEGSLDSDDTEDGITDLRSGCCCCCCCCCWRLAVVVIVIGLNSRSQNSTELVYLFIVKIFRTVCVRKRSAPTFCQPFWSYTAVEKSC